MAETLLKKKRSEDYNWKKKGHNQASSRTGETLESRKSRKMDTDSFLFA